MKKKIFGFIFAFAFMLTGAICLTACGPDHIDFDMFDKEYSIGSNKTAYFYYNDEGPDYKQTIDDVTTWLQTNGNKLAHSDNSPVDVQGVISALNNSHFAYNVKVKVASVEPTGNPRKGRVQISGGGFETTEFDFEGEESQEYPANYNWGNIKYEDGSSSIISVIASWDAKVKNVEVSFKINEVYYSNHYITSFMLNRREISLVVGYDLLSYQAI